MEKKDYIIILLLLAIAFLGLGFILSVQVPKNNSSLNNSTNHTINEVNTQNTQTQTQTENQKQNSNTQKNTQTQQSTDDQYVTLTCGVCGKQFKTPREGPQLSICDQCANSPEAEKLLQQAGYY